MRTTRRHLLAGAGAGIAAGLAGCTGGATSWGAANATLSTEVQNDTQFSHHRTTEDTITREFGVSVLTRTVEVTNVIAEYDRAIEVGPIGTRLQAAVFAVLSTPQVRMLGRTFNPVADMSTAEIAKMVQERYDQIGNVSEDREFEGTVAGESTTVTRFTATARLVEADVGLDVYLYVSQAVEAGEDFLVTLSVHPRSFDLERSTIEQLMGGVVHAPPEE